MLSNTLFEPFKTNLSIKLFPLNSNGLRVFYFFALQGGYKTPLPVQTSEGANKKYFENQEKRVCILIHLVQMSEGSFYNVEIIKDDK